LLYNTSEAPLGAILLAVLQMNDIEESLFQALNEIVEKKDMRVVNISISGLAKSPSIQIIIDSIQGVSLDDCSFVSKLTDDIIKVNGYYSDDYNLEVSSPGINRQLFSLDDFRLYKNSMVKIKLKKPINNRKNILGIIKVIKNENIILDVDQEEIKIDFKNIKKANIKEI
jgi:ribosome maturation factor RimP|tara:strand:+ start:110 stop:619 length:510 start_codon:yes stop_codon:yes gene_type:complete